MVWDFLKQKPQVIYSKILVVSCCDPVGSRRWFGGGMGNVPRRPGCPPCPTCPGIGEWDKGDREDK